MNQHDCIVIGGGVIGLSIARRLARAGRRILLLERNQTCGSEASWAAAGVLAPPSPNREDSLARFQRQSLAMMPAMAQELRDETGIDVEYEPCGMVQLLFSQEELSVARGEARAGGQQLSAEGLPAYELHAPDHIQQLEPVIQCDLVGALENRLAAQIRNSRLLKALRESAVRRDVEIRENTPVHELHVAGNRVLGVRVGEQSLTAPWIILAAGAWAPEMDERVGRQIPGHPVCGQMVLLRQPERTFCRIIERGKTYLVPRRDGHVLLGATEEHDSGFVKRTRASDIARLMEEALAYVPSLADATVEATWAGLRPGTPDDRPYLGAVQGFEGLLAATGHFRAGLILAPATAEYIASIVEGGRFDVDLSSCAPGRAIE